MTWWNNAAYTKATDWTFAPLLPEQVPGAAPCRPVVADSDYLHVFLRSMRVAHVRKGLHKFFGTVHSFASLPHATDQQAAFHVITTPGSLRDIDSDHLDRIVVMNQRLLGPIPYRGGDLALELGLFSIQSTDLAAPFLGLLEKLASAAGVAYVQTATPFVEPIRQGVEMLLGGSATTLEIGVSTRFPAPQTGYYLVMRAPKGAVDVSKLVVGPDFRVTSTTGQALDPYPYMVFSIEASGTRADWQSVPELVQVYQELKSGIRSRDNSRIQTTRAAFRAAALTSPELLASDAHGIVSRVEQEVKNTLALLNGPASGPSPLADIAA